LQQHPDIEARPVLDEAIERKVGRVVIVAQAKTANHGSEIKAQWGCRTSPKGQPGAARLLPRTANTTCMTRSNLISTCSGNATSSRRIARSSASSNNLHLKPWQRPPCWVENMEADLAGGDNGVMGRYAAATLLKRMLDAGISDPRTALEKAKPR
jgi:hypothetical protein